MSASEQEQSDLDFGAPSDSPALPICAQCSRDIPDAYWSAGTVVLCEQCKDSVQGQLVAEKNAASRAARFGRALALGFGGMLVGSAVWYAVAKFANIEAGIIAILLGFLVGKAVHLGSGRRGGRRYQILAVALTYLGIGLAYAPFAVEQLRASRASAVSTAAATPTPGTDDLAGRAAGELSPAEREAEMKRLDSVIAAAETKPAKAPQPGITTMLLGLGLILVGVLTLPVLVIIGGFPNTLISLVIYGIALVESWRLSRGVKIEITGPFRVGGAAPA